MKLEAQEQREDRAMDLDWDKEYDERLENCEQGIREWDEGGREDIFSGRFWFDQF